MGNHPLDVNDRYGSTAAYLFSPSADFCPLLVQYATSFAAQRNGAMCQQRTRALQHMRGD